MTKIKFTYKDFFYWVFVILIGTLYVSFLSNMPNEWFRDRENYLVYASSSDSIINLYDSLLILFFNEPVFLYLNTLLLKIFKYTFIPNLFVYFITTILVFFLGYNAKNVISFIFGVLLCILIPYILQGELVALRQGLATTFLIPFFFLLKDEKKVLGIIFFCSFIHSIFFLFFIFYSMNLFFLKNFSLNKKLFIAFVIMIIFSIVGIVFANYFGLRQGAQYMGVEDNSSGGAFILFFFVFAYFYFFGNRDNERLYEFVMVGLVMFLTSYYLSPISGRLFNTVTPFIVFLLISKSRAIDYIVIILLTIVYSFLFLNGSYYELLSISHLTITEYFIKYFQGFFSL